MAKDSNTVKFEVEGIGSFTAIKEEKVETFFLDSRKELSKMLGGRDELIKLERLYNRYADSRDNNDRDIATAAFLEIKRARMYLDMKNILKDTPEGFELDKLTIDEFDKLWMALEAARGNFRVSAKGTGEGTSQPTTA